MEYFAEDITKDFRVIGVDFMTPALLRKYINDNGKSIFIIDTNHTSIVNFDFSHISAWCDSLVSLKKEELKGSIFKLSYGGYDFDPREVYEIPEAVKFTKKMIDLYPELFYFLDIDSQKWILLSLNKPKVVGTKPGVDGVDKTILVDTDKLIADIMSIHKNMKRISIKDIVDSKHKLLKLFGGY